MGKAKKVTVEPEDIKARDVEGAKEAKAPKLAEVVRQGLNALGVDSSVSDMKPWIARHYPDLEYNEGTLSTTLSNQKKALKGAGGDGGTPKGRRGPAGPEVTANDLLAVKRIADESGGVEALMGQVQQVRDLADRVGSFEKLVSCLETLNKLIG
jgi:hypothetical protein